MKIRIFLIFSFLFVCVVINAQSTFEKKFREFLLQDEYKNASVGIHISETATGKTVFDYNAEKLFIPASVLKVVTSAVAMEILGADYRFQTRLGYSGEIEKGTLKGDLVIIGGGDPALGSEYFKDHYFAPHFLETWVQQIKAAGIKRVEGNLVLDCSLYDSEKIPPTWIWEDMGNYYGAGTSALTVYDNQFRISFRSPAVAEMPTEIISVYPKIEGINFKNEVLSSNENRDLAYVFGSPDNGSRLIRGTIPKNRRAFTIKASNPFPEKLLADDFMQHLARNGVFLSGKTVTEMNPVLQFNEIYTTVSPDLTEIIKVLNYESVNLFAEHLIKQISAEQTGTGGREMGLKLVSEFWGKKGLDTNQLIMEDGSGLSHFNAVTPEFLSSVLIYMAESSSNSNAFIESLPAAGKGTLQHFAMQNFPGNILRSKSGSMTRVRCYTGFLQAASGKNLTFSIMVNHFSGSHFKLIAELQKLLIELYNSN